MQAEGYDGELSPAQWMALRYFARANPFSRTPSAFAAFQATTVALRRKLSRHLRQVGTWSDSDRKRTRNCPVTVPSQNVAAGETYTNPQIE
jgi:hypothetical protein